MTELINHLKFVLDVIKHVPNVQVVVNKVVKLVSVDMYYFLIHKPVQNSVLLHILPIEIQINVKNVQICAILVKNQNISALFVLPGYIWLILHANNNVLKGTMKI